MHLWGRNGLQKWMITKISVKDEHLHPITQWDCYETTNSVTLTIHLTELLATMLHFKTSSMEKRIIRWVCIHATILPQLCLLLLASSVKWYSVLNTILFNSFRVICWNPLKVLLILRANTSGVYAFMLLSLWKIWIKHSLCVLNIKKTLLQMQFLPT